MSLKICDQSLTSWDHQSVMGTGAHSRYHPMMVGLQLNFTTDDGTMPIGNAGKEIFTDELQSRAENFQIV